MEAGRIGDGNQRSEHSSLRQQGTCISPFPFPLRGKPGREGSPHAAKGAAPPTRGLRPLVNPPRNFGRGCLTEAGLLMEAASLRYRPTTRLTPHVPSGMTEDEILRDFPYLEKEDFQAVYEFFASIPERIAVLEASR